MGQKATTTTASFDPFARGIDEATVRALSDDEMNAVIDHMVELRDQGQMAPFNEGNMRGTFTYWKAPNHLPWNTTNCKRGQATIFPSACA